MCVLCFTSDCRGTQKLMVKETSNLTCETNFTTKILAFFIFLFPWLGQCCYVHSTMYISYVH